MVPQHQYSTSNAMQALEKPCELLQVIWELWSHTVTLHYQRPWLYHMTHTAWKLQWVVCVCNRLTAYLFNILHWCYPISAKKQPCFCLFRSLCFPLWPQDHVVTWRKGHLTDWQLTFHFPAALGKDHLTTNITARHLPQDLGGVTCPLSHTSAKVNSSAFLYHLLLKYPCTVDEIIPKLLPL